MTFQITGKQIIGRTILPGAILGAVATCIMLYLGSFYQSTALGTQLTWLGLLILVACVAYYFFELRGKESFTDQAFKLCMFLASFSLASNLALVAAVPDSIGVEWVYFIVPAAVLVGCYYLEGKRARQADSVGQAKAVSAVKAKKPKSKGSRERKKG